MREWRRKFENIDSHSTILEMAISVFSTVVAKNEIVSISKKTKIFEVFLFETQKHKLCISIQIQFYFLKMYQNNNEEKSITC